MKDLYNIPQPFQSHSKTLKSLNIKNLKILSHPPKIDPKAPKKLIKIYKNSKICVSF